jgi:hypothetical protein
MKCMQEIQNVTDSLEPKNYCSVYIKIYKTDNNEMCMQEIVQQVCNRLIQLKYSVKPVPTYFSSIYYFDDKVPQNANMYISNLKTNYVVVFDGTKWVLKQMDEHLNELFLQKFNKISFGFLYFLITLFEYYQYFFYFY